MLKSFFLVFFVFSCFQQSEALEPDFFNRKKKISIEEKQRLKGASSYTKKRKLEIQKKEAKASGYRTVRKQAERMQKKQDELFESEMLKPEKDNIYMIKKAQKYANKKRKQVSDSWKTQNVEFDIEVQEPNILKKRKEKNK